MIPYNMAGDTNARLVQMELLMNWDITTHRIINNQGTFWWHPPITTLSFSSFHFNEANMHCLCLHAYLVFLSFVYVSWSFPHCTVSYLYCQLFGIKKSTFQLFCSVHIFILLDLFTAWFDCMHFGFLEKEILKSFCEISGQFTFLS